MAGDEEQLSDAEGAPESVAPEPMVVETPMLRPLERRVGVRGAPERALTRRALWVGSILVAFVAAFTPYNDYIIQNSPFIGNHFPIGIVTLVAALILVVNPLIMICGRKPLQTGELAAVMTMMLVGAAVPSSGLMRYLEPMVLSPFWIARDFSWLKPIANLMPAWLTPSKDPSSAIISNYWLGIDPVRGGSIPIVPFLIPMALWGILIAAILGSALFLAAIFRKQWVFHERLTFPLATIPLELMATPEPGHWYNRLWRNPILWVGAGIPIFVYLLAGLHDQFPALPFIDLKYDFRESFTQRPWDALPTYITGARLFLGVVGICFFIPSEIALSLWLFLILNGAGRVFFSETTIDPAKDEPVRAMGIYLAYFAGLLWLARGHLRMVLTAAWRNTPRDEAEPLAYRTMVVGYAACVIVGFLWLLAVGMNPLLAVVLMGLGTVLTMLMARIVAETGLFFVGPMWWPSQFIELLLGPGLVNTVSFYWSQLLTRIFFADLRETLMPFAVNSMRMGQEIQSSERPRWFRWLVIALLLSLIVSGGTQHYLSYTSGRTGIGDSWATNQMPFEAMQSTYSFTHTAPQTSLRVEWLQATLGAGMVGFLMLARVLWVWWPFHPIGLLMLNSWPLQVFWFSIFIGWGVKRLLLRYGGAGAFRRARPFFIGLLVGEMLSAGVWMFVGLATHGTVHYTLLP